MSTREPHEIVINLNDPAVRDEYGRPGGETLLRVTVLQNGKRSMVYLRALMWTGHPTKADNGIEFFLSHVKATKDIDRALYVRPWYVAKHCDHCGNEGQKSGAGHDVKARPEHGGTFECSECFAYLTEKAEKERKRDAKTRKRRK